MAKLPDKFSIAKPVVVDSVNGHPVRPVDVNGVALDDPTVQYSVAHPVIEVDVNGVVLADSTRVFSMAKKVRISPTGTPIIITDPTGTSTGGTLTGGTINLLTPTYDTTMGSAVDSNGYTTLPLRAGANRYFVGSGGSDVNTGLSHAQRFATLSKAWQTIVSGNGDQILIAEGTTLAETLPQSGDTGGWLGDKPGFSALYPTVFSSYDPADPLNEAKYGMGHQRSARPILTRAAGGGGAPAYVAVKGLVLNPGNTADVNCNFVGSALKYVLFENNIFAYTGLSFTDGGDGVAAALAQHIIIRNNSSYGVWSASTAHVGNIYADGINGLTYEDNVNYHSGWKIGATRDTSNALGGPDVFRHPFYFQANTNNVIVRRNLIMDGAADGGIIRGDNALVEENVTIRCPAGTGLGPGNTAEFGAFPNGVHIEARYNLSLAAIDLNSTNPSGYGYTVGNMAPGSRVHHNVLIYSAATNNNNDVSYATTGGSAYSLPTRHTYTEFEFNRSAHWSASGNATRETGTPIHSFYGQNVWDAVASGTNINYSSATFPNAYTEAQLYVAAGYADYTALVNDAINNPDKRPQRNLRTLAFTGYGVTASASLELDQTAPVLSASSGTATGTGTATVGVSTTEANGTLYCILSTSATPPHVSQIKMGLLADGSSAPKAASATVTTTGAQSINLTGITGGIYYVHFVHQDAAGNKSAVASTSGSMTITGFTPATLNPADMSGTGIALTNTNLTATTSTATTAAGTVGVRATKAITAKAYWEVHVDVLNDGWAAGIADSSATFSGSYWGSGGNTHVVAPFGSGGSPTHMFAVDPVAKLFWRGTNGVWTGDPVAGTGGTSFSTFTGSAYPAWQGSGIDKCTANFGATAYTYTPPSGYGNV